MIFPLPYSWLKEYVKVGADPKPVARDLTLFGATVERIHHVKYEWTGIVVAEIQKIEPHPNSDKLLLATVTTGHGSPRKIVCGAHNIAVGQKVPLALPGAHLSDQFKIAK